mmetsp:Transcript_42857/g.121452  ORF Transcript_42857/g.121452 Transcript_42857/m.121452 type:complete len:246 (+) Transcript_42857:772-1509(+)
MLGVKRFIDMKKGPSLERIPHHCCISQSKMNMSINQSTRTRTHTHRHTPRRQMTTPTPYCHGACSQHTLSTCLSAALLHPSGESAGMNHGHLHFLLGLLLLVVGPRQDFALTGSAGTNFIDAAFMQYRFLRGGGPSSNTWPRCAPLLASNTSVRRSKGPNAISFGSFLSMTCMGSTGLRNDNHPVPLSYLSSDENSGRPLIAPTHMPFSFVFHLYPLTVSPVNAISVPAFRLISYCFDVSPCAAF